MSDNEVLVVFVTAPDVGVARQIAFRLVQERLAACGNVLSGVTSVFRWEGDVQEEEEALLVLKTTGRVLQASGGAGPPASSLRRSGGTGPACRAGQ